MLMASAFQVILLIFSPHPVEVIGYPITLDECDVRPGGGSVYMRTVYVFGG